MIPPVHVILNPAAGGGEGRRARPEIERELGFLRVPFTIEETDRPGHAIELAAAAAASGAGTVIAAGGDGTVHEVVNGLLRDAAPGATAGRPVLGVIPVGTGNDLVKVVAGSADRRKAYEVLGAGAIRRFDVGRAEWEGGAEYFVNGLGTGVDVEVVRQIRRLPRLPGVLSYLVGLLRALVRFEPIPLRVRMDGERIQRKVMIIAVGNGCCLGGGFYICPGAEPDDGRLDVCIVNELNVFQIARVLPRVLRGTHAGMPEVTLRRATSIEIAASGDSPLFFQVDGELREPPDARELRVSLERAILPVLAAPVTVDAAHAVSGGIE
ncbi:MAG TPA: diacylglycerol kinase family protein [Longimicrobiales bacterium]